MNYDKSCSNYEIRTTCRLNLMECMTNRIPGGRGRGGGSTPKLPETEQPAASQIYWPPSLFRLNEIGSPMISMCTRIP